LPDPGAPLAFGTLADEGEPGDLVAEYQYDGQGRRVAKLIPSGGNWDHTDYYYENRDSHEWHEDKRNPL
jgi:YD repeat-containing protein